MSFIPATQGVVKEQAFDITAAATYIDLDGTETFVVVELPPNGTAVTIEVALRYTSGGQIFPAPIMPMAPLEAIGQTKGIFQPGNYSGGYSTTVLSGEANDYTNRVFFVPCSGAAQVYFRRTSVGTSASTIKHCVGPVPYVQALSRDIRTSLYVSERITLTATPYDDGDVLGGTVNIDPFGREIALYSDQLAQLRFRGIAFTDYARGMGDFDLIVANAGDNSDLANGDPLDLDYGESVFGWYEFRTAPTGNQHKLYDYGASGGVGCQVNGQDLVIPYGSMPEWISLIFVNRAGTFTPTAGNCWFTLALEI